ncbi:MAG: VWA domain-containing protein [Bacteroidetes bacterium]|nr:VWA domain-containing protein [Bacteroidota bacterium]
MIRFAHPEYLYLLFALPLLLALMMIMNRAKNSAREKFASAGMFNRLAETYSSKKIFLKGTLMMFSLLFLAVALANPQVGARMEDVKQEGIDIFIALDVSRSMLAEDVKPNRLEKAKYEIRNLINRLAGDRVGLIVFSGEAYTQFPLTIDYSAANLFLDVIGVESVPNPGTAVGSAISQAMKSFNFEEPTTKVIIIITDGENNSGDAVDQAKEAAEKGVLIYTVGMGSPQGAPIPVYDAGGKQIDFKRDRSGNIVITKLDEATLQEISSIGKGKYYLSTNSQDELDAIYKDINALQKREIGTKQFTEFDDKFQYFLLAAILLLCWEIILSEKKSVWLAKHNPFSFLKKAEESL